MTEAQANSRDWTPPQGPLGELTALATTLAGAAQNTVRGLEIEAATASPAPSFLAALSGTDVRLIAELKRQSPSKGVINAGMDIVSRATDYVAGGAAAISVLTERSRFGGSLDDLRAVRSAVTVPLLRKDFMVDRVQLLEARVAGASAVLLIARALVPAHFSRLAREAGEIGLELLLEVRDEWELERAVAVGSGAIGVNNRNLETLVIDDRVSERLIPLIPSDRIAVYESGVRDRQSVQRAAALGASAVLVGSSLSQSSDGRHAVAALVGVPRSTRG